MKKVEIADPFILKEKNLYYLYGTSALDGFYVYTSTDLKNWSKPQYCYQKTESSFGYCDFWAPEVTKYHDKYYMFYSARWKKNDSLRIGLSISDSPTGPFKDVSSDPFFDLGYATIDAHLFIDDNKSYLFYSKDCSENVINQIHESHIYGVELEENLMSIKGNPTKIIGPTTDWECQFNFSWRWTEGPFILKWNKKYHLLYSTNCFETKEYSICAAVSNNSLGPYEKYEENPLLKYDETISGPGHCSILKIDDLYVCVYHIHKDNKHPSAQRVLCYSKLYFEKNHIKILKPNKNNLTKEII